MVHIKDMDVFAEWKKQKRDRMVKYNQNWLCLIVGGTGSSKSWDALSLADEISPHGFDMKHMCFRPRDIIRVINHGKLKPGNIVIADELGVSMSSRDWYQIQNKFLSYLFQTFREMNVGLIATVPAIKFIDSSMRILFHNRIETIQIHRRSNLAEVKVYDLEYNNFMDRMFTKTPVFIDEFGNKVSMPKIFIPKPRDELIEEYEKASKKYKKELRMEVEKQLSLNDSSKQLIASCPACGNSSYRYTKSKNLWTCRTCGEEFNKNPFKRT